MFTGDNMRDMLNKIVSDPTSVDTMEADEVAAVRKHIDPLGVIHEPSDKKSYANVSIINYREQYLTKLLMTALVGYLHRTASEHRNVPEEELSESVKAVPVAVREEIIQSFLGRNFEFNPELHIRGAHTENTKDPERKPKSVPTSNQVDQKIRSKSDQTYTYLRDIIGHGYTSIVAASDATSKVLSVLSDDTTPAEDLQGILMKNLAILNHIKEDLGNVAKPLATAETVSAYVEPPADTFHNFKRYFENNFESLRGIVNDVYNEKPDIEFAVKFYKAFKSAESARDYRSQHEADFTDDVFTIESGVVTVLGPFKQNRERLDFYNKNTEIMKQLMQQMESDHKLGKDMMDKQIKTKKKKNIEEAGPDNPELTQYSKHVSTAASLGAKKGLSKEEAIETARKIEEAKTAAAKIKESYETPDDTVRVGVFHTKVDDDGNRVLDRTDVFTQAEAHLHVQDNSEFVDKYQPIRNGKEQLFRTKVITSKEGKKMEVVVPFENDEVDE
jgi:hypothetical protein